MARVRKTYVKHVYKAELMRAKNIALKENEKRRENE